MLVLLLESVCRMPSRRLNFLAHFLRAWESLHVPLAFYFISFYLFSCLTMAKGEKKRGENEFGEQRIDGEKKDSKQASPGFWRWNEKEERGYGRGSCQMLCINRCTPVGVSILVQDIPYKSLASTWRLWRMGARYMGVVTRGRGEQLICHLYLYQRIIFFCVEP